MMRTSEIQNLGKNHHTFSKKYVWFNFLNFNFSMLNFMMALKLIYILKNQDAFLHSKQIYVFLQLQHLYIDDFSRNEHKYVAVKVF